MDNHGGTVRTARGGPEIAGMVAVRCAPV